MAWPDGPLVSCDCRRRLDRRVVLLRLAGQPPAGTPEWKKQEGIKGDLWAIHGGGIYEVAKYQLGPKEMPRELHWFKWEAYSTWLSGMALLFLVYYLGSPAT